MNAPTPAVKAPKTTSATRCARCGRKLKAGTAHTVTILGTLGRECEQYAAQALMILHRAGLGVLATQGEIRLPGLRHADGSVSVPGWEALRAQAHRIGLELTRTFDPATREAICTLKPTSARELLNRREGVAA